MPCSLADTEPFFAGLNLLEPGLVPMATGRPYGGVARKP